MVVVVIIWSDWEWKTEILFPTTNLAEKKFHFKIEIEFKFIIKFAKTDNDSLVTAGGGGWWFPTSLMILYFCGNFSNLGQNVDENKKRIIRLTSDLNE